MRKFNKVFLATLLTFFLSFNSLIAVGVTSVAEASGDEAQNATVIASGETLEGSLDAEETDHWYYFETTGDSKAEVELTFPSGLDGRVLLYNGNLTPIQNIDSDTTAGKESGLAYLEGAGKFYLQVLTYNTENKTIGATDKYTLKVVTTDTELVKDQNEPNNSKSKATALELEKAVKGTIMASGDEDVYKINIPSKGDLELNLVAPEDLDVGLLFFDSKMAEAWAASDYIRGADYGFEGEDETLKVWIEEPGTYYVLVGSSTGAASTKEYTLSTELIAVKTFSDIKNHWAKKEIEPLATRGVIEGMKPDVFAPESKVTRAQFATMLVRALGLEEYTGTEAQFTDVKKADWHFRYVEAAASAGIVNGYTNGSFGPNDYITREQMAAMIVRAMDIIGYSEELTTAEQEEILADFTDKAKVSTWAKEEVALAIYMGIVNGVTETTLVPLANAKRAEAATMIKRMMVETELL